LHNRRDSATDCPATNGAFISCYRKKAEGNSSSPLRLRWLPGPLLLASRNRSGSPRPPGAPDAYHARALPSGPRVRPAWSKAEVGAKLLYFSRSFKRALQRLEVPLLVPRCNP
jgi:hypothetical protein